MFNQRINNRISPNGSGQTLVIAIMVMFILMVISAVFVAMVARNLFRSERFSNVDSVAQIAEAGIRYADKMLISGEDGADWRPKPDNLAVAKTPIPSPPDIRPVADSNWTYWRDNHPDYKWVRPYWHEELGFAGPSGGFTTFKTGGGRFLLRVTYDPKPNDPLSKYIKIESIGRWGLIENDDPTTLARHGNTGMRREITAYKPIGVTDYLRFITNKDHRSINFPLGCPGYSINFGRSNSNSNIGPRGAPIRVNGNLLWYGNGPNAVQLYLRGVPPLAGSSASTDPDDLIALDRVEVAGDIKVADTSMGIRLYRMGIDGNIINPAPIQLPPSDDPNFASVNGFYRDAGGQSSDATRRIKRLEPPLLDNPDTTDTTTRYRLLTLNSGDRVLLGTSWINLGRYGWGRGVYIDNTNDIQDESNTLFGGYSLRADWLKPNNPVGHWNGPNYTPPGVYIVLNPRDTDNDGQPDMTITRTDGAWHDSLGEARPDWGNTITMPYPDPTNGRTIQWRDSATSAVSTRHIDGNGVIYAEGNIRIRGMLPKGMQLTVISNENIYIEGSVLKYRDPASPDNPSGPYRTTGDETESCGIALLARQNVCVNTTQFFSNPGVDTNTDPETQSVIISNDPDGRLRMAFEFGPYESESASVATDFRLFLRHSGQYGTSYINAWLNARNNLPDWGILYLNEGGLGRLPMHVWGIGDPAFNTPGWGIGSSFIGEVFPLTLALNAHLNTKPGMPNDIQIGLDQTSYTRNNYLFGGMAVQPMDVRIEAVIYAQEGSFFVLPGRWFNPNPSDARPANDANRTTASRPGGVRPGFPFFGDPLDIRIIIDGAITENMPATISDVNEWMSKWGKIPATYGSSTTRTAHPGEGLTILYDDHAGWPYIGLGTDALKPIRRDIYGRTLPIAPRLPVCGSLIYFGDVM
ncbi:MAG: hypothetical protein ACYC64_13075 [Armatimonadota bacterium]